MKVEIKYIIIALALFIVGACSNQKKSILRWSFEESDQNEILESVHGQFMPVQSLKKNLELVQGISGKGLRSDGYSTFIKTKIPESLSNISSEAWFALETYPTDTAGFFSFEQDVNNWIAANINQFGELMLSVCINGKTSWHLSELSVNKFEWFNLALSVDKNEARLMMNGKTAVNALIAASPLSFSSILIGRDSREKKIHIFPVNYINGIIDEIKVWDKTLSENDFNTDEIERLIRINPDLSVPSIRFEGDFHRPKYHLLPAANWTNETHGLIYYNGNYHIFNQKNGTNVYLGQINWGYFSSPDLVHWTEHHPVLTPEPGYDQLGIWSGHCVLDDMGNPVIVYTGGDGGPNGMCLAFPKDTSLVEWEKYNGNPVIDGPPEQYTRKDFRDPYVWKENDTWFMIVGYGIEEDEKKGSVLLYKSSDMKNWEFLHPLFSGDPSVDGSGVFWEMPVFWKMNGKYILLVNPIPYEGKPAVAIYWTGDFINERFIPDHKTPTRLEVINRMLSPSVALDEKGQTTAIAIIPDLIPAEMQIKQGWTHLYSIPRTWELVNGKICQKPHPAIKKLRNDQITFPEQEIMPGQNLVVSTGKHQLEIIAKIVPQNCERFGFNIGKNAGNGEVTPICFDLKNDMLLVDLTRSNKNEQIRKEIESGDYKLNKNEPVELHLFIDGSVVEGFINGKDAFTTRIFPEFENSNEVELFSEGGSLNLLEMKVWELKSNNFKTEF